MLLLFYLPEKAESRNHKKLTTSTRFIELLIIKLPKLNDCVLLAIGWVVSRNICDPSFFPEKVTGLAMYIEGLCLSTQVSNKNISQWDILKTHSLIIHNSTIKMDQPLGK